MLTRTVCVYKSPVNIAAVREYRPLILEYSSIELSTHKDEQF